MRKWKGPIRHVPKGGRTVINGERGGGGNDAKERIKEMEYRSMKIEVEIEILAIRMEE